MDKNLVRANAVGWGIIGACMKAGMPIADAIEIAKAECGGSELAPAFFATIAKIEGEFTGRPTPEPFSPHVPASTLELCTVGWITTMLERTLTAASHLLRERLACENTSDAESYLFALYFTTMLNCGCPASRAIEAYLDEFDEESAELEAAAQATDDGESPAAAFKKNVKLLPASYVMALTVSETNGDLRPVFDAVEKLRPKNAKLAMKPRSPEEDFYLRMKNEFEKDTGVAHAFKATMEGASGPIHAKWSSILKELEHATGEADLGAILRDLSEKERRLIKTGFETGMMPTALDSLLEIIEICRIESHPS